VIEERDGADAVVAYYTYGDAYVDEVLTMDRGGSRYYFHSNRLFSTYALTNSAGAVVERYFYTPYGMVTTYDSGYGNPQSSSRVGNPFTFTGRELDAETGLYHFRARTYDPAEGRFKQRDPLGYVGGWNLYEYVQSSPTMGVDPEGEGFWFAAILWIARHWYVTVPAAVSTTQSILYNPRTLTALVAVDVAGKACTGDDLGLRYWVMWGEPSSRCRGRTGGPSMAGGDGHARLVDRMEAFRAYQAGGGKMSLSQWVTHTSRNPNWGHGVKSGFLEWDVSVSSTHGNSRLSQRTCYLYRLVDKDGTFLKWGVTQDMATRFPKEFMRDKRIIKIDEGSRRDMLGKERALVETNPGPLNREPWAGKASMGGS
jgi:RHS repeat-associated protein